MASNQKKLWGVALGAAALCTFAMLPEARSELAFENGTSAEETLPTQVIRADERAAIRTGETHAVIGPSGPAAVAPAAPVAAPAQVQVQVGQPAVIYGDPNAAEARQVPKSELLRRQRIRTELKNEDLLQERLEELRLRNEQKVSDHLNQQGQGILPSDSVPMGAAAATQSPMLEQKVVTPATDNPGQGAAPQAPTTVMMDSKSTATATNVSAPTEEQSIFTVTPRAGLSGINSTGIYDVNSRYAAGFELGLASTDNLAFTAGYTYSEYGIGLAANSPYALWANNYGYYGSTDRTTFKKNTIDAGLKMSLLNPEARLRPFIGGGGAWSKGYVNYDQAVLNQLMRTPGLYGMNAAQDYQLTQFLGYVSTGFDVRVSKGISVGALFKYYAVLSSTQNANLNNAALYGIPVSPADYEKADVAGTISRSGSYMIMAGATFSF